MVRKIIIENSSGISEEVVLNFNKGKYDYRSEYIYKDTVVNPVILYGSNSSGKTSILKSILNIIEIFNGDLQEGKRYAIANCYTNSNLTKIGIEFELANIDYFYEVTIEDGMNIIEEILQVDGMDKFTRKMGKISYRCQESDTLDTFKKVLSEIDLNRRTSFIRYLGREGFDKEISGLYNYFRSFKFIATNKRVTEINVDGLSEGERLVKYNDEYIKIIKQLSNIMPLRFETKQVSGKEVILAMYEKNGRVYELDYETMVSSGTKDLYSTLAVLFSMERGSVLVLDELEKTFHPELLDELIRIINKEFDIQIIGASHNTRLMQSLRPDQIFFTKKDNNDIVRVSKLSEEESGIREIHNIEKLYYGGRIG